MAKELKDKDDALRAGDVPKHIFHNAPRENTANPTTNLTFQQAAVQSTNLAIRRDLFNCHSSGSIRHIPVIGNSLST